MPKQHIRFSYTFDELSADAQKRAVEIIAEKLGGDWWDSHENLNVANEIVYSFARALDPSAYDEFGVDDFPGIDGIKLDGWSVGHVQGDYVGFSGTLTRENAPGLPWMDGIEHVTLEAKRSHTAVWFAMADDSDSIDVSQVRLAVRESLTKALDAGYAAADYASSEERATDYIENNPCEFNEDGTLF